VSAVRSRYAGAVQRVDKPWGHELIWAREATYVGKLLVVRAGHALSLQYHERKEESWYVQEGRATLELGEYGSTLQAVEIGPGDAFHFMPGTVHRVTAIDDTVILEVSTPELDDVVRLEDRYGRAGEEEAAADTERGSPRPERD
jgi:mannose-6-phosphate isomerase-like protein (cupin superfamily)